MSRDNGTARLLLSTATALALLSLACSIFPRYVIRPFRHQGAGELSAALFVNQVGPVVSALCAVLCVALTVRFRKRLRSWPSRIAALVTIVLAVIGGFLTHVNVYEKMFHPVDAPAFDTAQHAKVDGDDMVITVNVRGNARAYPIREMAYHHIVNDVVAGEPIAATY